MKTKKLLAILLVLTFVLGSFSVGFAAYEEELPSEVVRAQALGVLRGDDHGNLNLDNPITRAEALALVIRISGLEKSAELMSGQTQFPDVGTDPRLQWATGYINLGVGQGIINGYPDGTFQGTKEVTYAEMAKMLLYAMNYGVTVEGAPWPAGVMGKADDLKVFDKVNALPNIPAIRGDVVKMIDNSLAIKHLKQIGYGDLTQYLEGEDSFLSKMDIDELEDVRVTEIARVNNKLDDDEIVLTEYDKYGREVDSDIYRLIADVNPEEIFGLEVDAWVNDDDEVFFVNVKTAEKDIVFDTVVKADKNKVELKVEDDEFDWAKEVAVYENFKLVKPDKVTTGAFGKIVLNKGDVEFANFFNFGLVKGGVVTELKNDRIYYNMGENERSIRLDDYKDGVYVYNAKFQAIDLEDIEEDDVIYAWKDGKKAYIVVAGEIIEGRLERIRDEEIRVDGKAYDVAGNATASNNEDKDIKFYKSGSGVSDTARDLAGNDVEVILDINGEVRHIRGDAKATSGDLYGIVMDAYRDGGRYILTIFNSEGKKIGVEVDKKTDWEKYYDEDYIPVVYNVNKDNVIKEGNIDNVDETENEFTCSEFDKDKNYIKAKHGEEEEEVLYFVEDSTVLMKYEDNEKQALVDWDEIKSKEAKNSKAYIIGDAGKAAKFIVFYEGISGIVEENLYGIVTSNPEYDGDDWIVEIDVSGEGKMEYIVDGDYKNISKGEVVTFTIDSNNEITDLDSESTAKEIEKVDGKYIKLEGSSVYLRLDSDTVAYMNKKGNKLDKKIDIFDIDEGDSVYIIEKDSFVKTILVLYEVPEDNNGDNEDDDEIEIHEEGKLVAAYKLEGKVYIQIEVEVEGDSVIATYEYVGIDDATALVEKIGKSVQLSFVPNTANVQTVK